MITSKVRSRLFKAFLDSENVIRIADKQLLTTEDTEYK